MRRKHSIIDKLPADIKETVDEMVRANFTYRDIVDYIRSTGNDISLASVGRYAANLNETVRSIRMAQENFRAIMEETERHPNLDATDGILCILSNQLLEAVNSLPDEQLQSADLNSLIKNSVALTKAVAYKKNIELKNKDILETGIEQVKSMIFEAMAEERPELYKEVMSFVTAKQSKLKTEGQA